MHRFKPVRGAALAAAVLSGGCAEPPDIPQLAWYVFDEPSGAFAEAAANCSAEAGGRYRISLRPLPTDAD